MIIEQCEKKQNKKKVKKGETDSILYQNKNQDQLIRDKIGR